MDSASISVPPADSTAEPLIGFVADGDAGATIPMMRQTAAGPVFMTETDAAPDPAGPSKVASRRKRSVMLEQSMMTASFSPRKAAKARLVAKSKGGSDSEDSEDDPTVPKKAAAASSVSAPAAVRPLPGDSSSAASSARGRQKGAPRPSLTSCEYPGIDPETLQPIASDTVPLDHGAIQSVIDSVTMKDPTMKHDKNIGRFVRTKEFSHLSISLFWVFTTRCKLSSFHYHAQERVLRGENPATVQAELEHNLDLVTRSEADGFKVAAVAYGSTFASMMARQGHNTETAIAVRDSLFERLPILLSKTVFYLLTLVFSSSADHREFSQRVREDILMLVSRWVSGVQPQNAQLQASTMWPTYARRKEVKSTAEFDEVAMTRKLDERSAAEFAHVASMRAMQDDFGMSFAGLRRNVRQPDELSARGGSMRRGLSGRNLKGLDGLSAAGSGGGPASVGTGGDRQSAKDSGALAGIASPRTVNVRTRVPNQQNGLRWYEQGGVRGSLTVERATDASVARQPWQITANSPLVAAYLEMKNIQRLDPGQAGITMTWTMLTELDRRGTTFKFGALAKPKAKKAAAYCREDRRNMDAIIDRERREVVAGQRAFRYNMGKAKLAGLHIRALHTMRHSNAQAIYTQLRSRLLVAISKSGRRGDAHITEVIGLANSVLKQVSDYIQDIPHPGSAELQRLSVQCFRGVCRLNRFHKLVMDDAAAKEGLIYHSISDSAAAALDRIFEDAKQSVPAADDDLMLLLKDSAQQASRVDRELRVERGEDVSDSESVVSASDAGETESRATTDLVGRIQSEDALGLPPDDVGAAGLGGTSDDWVVLPTDVPPMDAADNETDMGLLQLPPLPAAKRESLDVGAPPTARPHTATPDVSTEKPSEPAAASSMLSSDPLAATAPPTAGDGVQRPPATAFHGSRRPSFNPETTVVDGAPVQQGDDSVKKPAAPALAVRKSPRDTSLDALSLPRTSSDHSQLRQPATARVTTRRNAPAALTPADILDRMAPTPPGTSRRASRLSTGSGRDDPTPKPPGSQPGTASGSRTASRNKSSWGASRDAAWRLAKEPRPDFSRAPSVQVVQEQEESSSPMASDNSPTSPRVGDVASTLPSSTLAQRSGMLITKPAGSTTYHTPRSSRATPTSRPQSTTAGMVDLRDFQPSPPSTAGSPRGGAAIASPKHKVAALSHTVRHGMDSSRSSRTKPRSPPRSKVESVPWWMPPPPEPPAVIVPSVDATRTRPDPAAPRYQQGTTTQQLRGAGVTSVAHTVERQVRMATIAAGGAPQVPVQPDEFGVSLRGALHSDGKLPSPPRPATQGALASSTSGVRAPAVSVTTWDMSDDEDDGPIVPTKPPLF